MLCFEPKRLFVSVISTKQCNFSSHAYQQRNKNCFWCVYVFLTKISGSTLVDLILSWETNLGWKLPPARRQNFFHSSWSLNFWRNSKIILPCCFRKVVFQQKKHARARTIIERALLEKKLQSLNFLWKKKVNHFDKNWLF